MIPSAILFAKLHMEDKTETEARILELSNDYFTIRLPQSFKGKHGQIIQIVLSFFLWEKNCYEDITLNSFEFTISEVIEEKFYKTVHIETSDRKYKKLSEKLSTEYLKYIDLKLEANDDELSHELCKYPLNEDYIFPDSFDSFMKQVSENIKEFSFDPEDIYVSLETQKLINDYVEYSKEAFFNHYFEYCGLADNPLSNKNITGIYIGNSYCPCLIPDTDMIIKAASKAFSENLKITFVLPPIPESLYEDTKAKIAKILPQLPLKTEIEVNDTGIFSYIESINARNITLIKGIMFYKERRDPRSYYTVSDTPSCMYDEKGVFFPFYQTNTGTFCPLYACIVNHSRERSLRVNNCPKYCSKHAFLYPKHLNMIGRYNSLFGFTPSLEKTELSQKRVVINL